MLTRCDRAGCSSRMTFKLYWRVLPRTLMRTHSTDQWGTLCRCSEIFRLSCSEARVGGMVGGKCGLVHVHVGTGPTRLAPLREALAVSDVPISQFLPTHMERSDQLVDEGLDWLRAGGSIDFTAGKDVRAPQTKPSCHDSKRWSQRCADECTASGSARSWARP